MTIEQRGIVDLISIPPNQQVAYLIVSDHLEWGVNDNEHCVLVQEKINEYLSFIEGGALIEARPDLKSKRLVLKVIGLHKPSLAGQSFYTKFSDALANTGYPFIFEHAPQDSIGST
jgi:hypothetical protein